MKKPNQSALITGASSGIGMCYAKVLAEMGFNLVLVSNQKREIYETATQIANQYGLLERNKAGINSTTAWVAGVYKNLAHPNAAEELFELYPDITVLVNNAGIFIFKDVVDCSIMRIETLLNLHIVTVTKLCRLYGEQMKKRGNGYILNMSSISAHMPFPGISLYAASKSYLRVFSKALGYELKGAGVRVMTVSPGAVATNLYNLPPHLQKLGMRIGIIYPPERLAKKGIDRLLRGHRAFIPGGINRCFLLIYQILPNLAIQWIRGKTLKFNN